MVSFRSYIMVVFMLVISQLIGVSNVGAGFEADQSGTSVTNAKPLAGRVIVVNPAHGWYFNPDDLDNANCFDNELADGPEGSGPWCYQRDEFGGIREDLLTVDIAEHLVDRLREAGATVYPTRELDRNAGTHGNRPWRELATRHYLRDGLRENIPASVHSRATNGTTHSMDLNSRPFYANYRDADMLINIHTNGTRRIVGFTTGTLIISDASLEESDSTWSHQVYRGSTGHSDRLAMFIQNGLLPRVRQYDENWEDRYCRLDHTGECRIDERGQEYGPKAELWASEAPSVIIEVAFHDSAHDRVFLRQPAFHEDVARGIFLGILNYFQRSDNCDLTNIPFCDILKGHSFFDEIQYLRDLGITSGYSDDTFRSDEPITRGEISKFIVRGMGHESRNYFWDRRDDPFTDITYYGSSYSKFYDEIRYLAAHRDDEQLGEFRLVTPVINGYSDGSYRPDNHVTRGELAAFIDRARANINTKEKNFVCAKDTNGKYIGLTALELGIIDVPEEHAFHDNIACLVGKGVVRGYTIENSEFREFKPDQAVTRGETAKFIASGLRDYVPSNKEQENGKNVIASAKAQKQSNSRCSTYSDSVLSHSLYTSYLDIECYSITAGQDPLILSVSNQYPNADIQIDIKNDAGQIVETKMGRARDGAFSLTWTPPDSKQYFVYLTNPNPFIREGAGYTFQISNGVESPPSHTYRVNPTDYQCGTTKPTAGIIKARFESDDEEIKVSVRKCDDTRFTSTGQAYVQVDNMYNYDYDVNTTSYQCGWGDIIKFRLRPDDGDHNLRAEIRKCDNGNFSKDGRAYIYVDGQRKWGPVSYRQGDSSVSFDIEPIKDFGLTNRHTYQARVLPSGQSEYIYSGNVQAWENYDRYTIGPFPYYKDRTENTFTFDPIAEGLTGSHTYQIHLYPPGQSAPIRSGNIRAWDELLTSVTATRNGEVWDEVGIWFTSPSGSPDGYGRYQRHLPDGTGTWDFYLAKKAGYTISADGYSFSEQADHYRFRINSADSLTVNYIQECYTLVQLREPSVGGTINVSPEPNCGNGRYTHGTNVTLNAAVNGGYRFIEWGGDASGSSASATVVMGENKTVVANFEAKVIDPIVPGTVNVARGKPVSASGGHNHEMLVDGNLSQGWSARAFRPQWVEIDLQAPTTLHQIRMKVNQSPAGQTVHRVYVSGADRNFSQIHEFNGFTLHSDWLVHTLLAPMQDIRYVKVETVESPSWIAWLEIEVYGLSGQTVCVSSTSGGRVGGERFRDEDILCHDTATGLWSILFDGSTAGLPGKADINAFHILEDGPILMSFDRPLTIRGFGKVDDSDIVKYDPATGTWELYFKGRKAQLTKGAEDIDAFFVLPNGDIVISTIGTARVRGIRRVKRSDMIAFTPTQLGEDTQGTWRRYFIGRPEKLTSRGENIWGAAYNPATGRIYFTTPGTVRAAGFISTKSEIIQCVPNSGEAAQCTFTSYWKGADFGFGGENLNGIHILSTSAVSAASVGRRSVASTPSAVAIHSPDEPSIMPNMTRTLEFVIDNLTDNQEVYDVQAESKAGWALGSVPTTLTIPARGSVVLPIEVTQNNESTESEFTLTVKAQNSADIEAVDIIELEEPEFDEMVYLPLIMQ